MILLPFQYYQLLDCCRTYDLKMQLKFLFLTGVRYFEAVWVYNNPTCYKPQLSLIYLPKRCTRLCATASEVAGYIVSGRCKKFPSTIGMDKNIISWCDKIGIETFGLKDIRATTNVWLAITYPNRELEIFESQNIYTFPKYEFSVEEEKEIKKLMEGW